MLDNSCTGILWKKDIKTAVGKLQGDEVDEVDEETLIENQNTQPQNQINEQYPTHQKGKREKSHNVI